MNITREQAICMFFCEDYNEENITKLSKKIEDFGCVDICYEDDPKKPVLVCLSKIRGDPFTWKRYLSKNSPLASEESTETDSKLVSELQVMSFLNEVYSLIDPQNDDVYELKRISTNHVYQQIIARTECMDNKSPVAFAKWCTKRDVNFINAPFMRKRERGSSHRVRELYVMKDEYLNDVVEAITNYIPRYQAHLEIFKNDNYNIVGYARKSLGDEDEERRVQLLQKMIHCLRERSHCQNVFVSTSCSANDPLASRDLNKETNLLNKLTGVDGNTQEMISYISLSEKDICLVVIDFAGLSTNCNDVKSFVSKHKNLKKIMIDRLPFDHKVHEFERDAIINDPETLCSFDCRSKPIQRSREI